MWISTVFALLFSCLPSFAKNADEASTGSVQVTVIDPAGKPIPDARVAAFRWEGRMQLLGTEQCTDSEGKAELDHLPAASTLYVSVRAAGLSPSEVYVELGQQEKRNLSFTLKPATTISFTISDPNGHALENAQFQRLDFVDPDGREIVVTETTAESLGLALRPSDAEGRLTFPGIYEGARITAWVWHPEWCQAKVENIVASAGRDQMVQLRHGVPIEIKLVPWGKDLPTLESTAIEVRMLPVDGGSRSEDSVLRQIAVQNGSIRFTAAPVVYDVLLLMSDNYFLTPHLDASLMRKEPLLDLRDRETLFHEVVVRRARKVRGRIASSDQRPLANVYVWSRIANLGPKGLVGKTVSEQWSSGDGCETDENGYYELKVAEGAVAIEASLDGYFQSPSRLVFEATPDLEELPPIQLTPLPTLRGTVVGSSGKPVPEAFIRIRSTGLSTDSTIRFSDSKGRFELPVADLPLRKDFEGRLTTVFVVAIDPESGDAGRIDVDLTSSAPLTDLQVMIKPQKSEWILNPLADQPLGLRTSEETEARRKLHADRCLKFPAGIAGQPAPELSRGTWLNTEARSLADFKGKFVLLDFWFIGCGPCHADLPTVKTTHQAFRERGFSVISIHNKSQSAEAVAAHAKEHEMTFPIVVDNSEGSILADYGKLGVIGYPSYLLIDPNGRILINDNMADPDQPILRLQKTEAVLHAMRSWK